MKYPTSFKFVVYKDALATTGGFYYFDDGYPDAMRVAMQFWGGNINDVSQGVDQYRKPSFKPIVSRRNFLIDTHEAITLLDTTIDDYGSIVYVQVNPDTNIIFAADYAESEKYSVEGQRNIYKAMIGSIHFLD